MRGTMSNIVLCIFRISQFGRWTDSQCTAVKSDNSHTVCKCSLPGHFMVISVNTNKTVSHLIWCTVIVYFFYHGATFDKKVTC